MGTVSGEGIRKGVLSLRTKPKAKPKEEPMPNLWKKAAVLLLAALICLPTAAQAITPDQLKSLLTEYYINDVPQQALEADTIEDIIQALGDPYTMYLTREEFEQFQASMSDATMIGIGITAAGDEDGLRIVGVYRDSPAEKLGLTGGDVILQVDGNIAAGQPAEIIASWLRGVEGTQVTFTVRHENGTTQVYTATRAKVVVPATMTEQLDNSPFAVISSTSFGQETLGHFVEGTTSFDDVRAWIVDMRGNVGGDVNAAAQSVGVFLGKCTVVYLRDGNDQYVRYVSDQDSTTLYPPIVLVSEETASSAEIFAQAIKDSLDGLIIGSNTFGKGVAQIILTQEEQPEALSDGDALRITAFQSYGTSGNTTQNIGVIPDLLVPAEDADDIALLLSPQEPAGDKTGWMYLAIGGPRWYVDLSQATKEETAAAFSELLSALPPRVNLHLGEQGGWVRATPEEAAEKAGAKDFAPRRFSDVKGLDCQVAADTLYTYGILKGGGDGTFHPADSMTRAELCALLVQAINLPGADYLPDFSDVPSNSWYAPYVKAAQAAGYMKGIGGGKFAPLEPVTHEQLITVLGRMTTELNIYFREAGKSVPQETSVPDSFSSWSRPWVWLLAESQRNYMGQTLSMLYAPMDEIAPRENATRGETAQILYNIFYMTGLIKY